MKSIREALTKHTELLTRYGIEYPRLEVEILLAYAINQDRVYLFAHQDEIISGESLNILREACMRRTKREPLAYIIGHKEFYGLDLTVTPEVMIPRPETELLVDEALNLCLGASDSPNLVVAEPGTGSGAISIALAKQLDNVRIYSSDISDGALSIAEINVSKFNVEDKVTLLKGNLLSALPEPPDLIVSNLPYIPSRRIPFLQPEIDWEPTLALDGGEDGLDLIRHLIHVARHIETLRDIILEIDCSQAKALKTIVLGEIPTASIEVIKDLSGLDRVISIHIG